MFYHLQERSWFRWCPWCDTLVSKVSNAVLTSWMIYITMLIVLTMFKLNTMTIWNSKQPRTLGTYILIFHTSHASHVLLIYITMWIEWLMFKFNTTIILNSKQVLKIWVHSSHTGPFKLETILLLHLFSAPHPKSTMHHQSIQHSFWLNPPDGARSKVILVACICIVLTVAVSS